MKCDLVSKRRWGRVIAGAVILLAVSCHQSETEIAIPSGASSSNDEFRLGSGVALEREITPGESHSYDLALEADEYVELTIEQLGADVVVRLLAPSGSLLRDTDLPIGDLGRETLIATAQETGIHRVEVSAWDSETAAGRYVASLEYGPSDPGRRLRVRAADLFYQAEQFVRDRDFDSAIGSYDASLDLWRTSEDSFWQARSLEQLGAALEAQGDYHRSVEVRTEANHLFTDLGETRFAAMGELSVGYLHFKLGDMSSAVAPYRRSLDLAILIQDRRTEASALVRLADVYKVQGETQDALDSYSKALKLFGEAKDKRYRATVLHGLGTLYRRMGEHQTALRRFQEAEEIYARLAIKQYQAASLSQIGQVYLELGDAESALAPLNAALGLRRQYADERGQSVALRRIGSAHLAMGDANESLAHYRKALELLDEIDAPRSRARLLMELGTLYEHLKSPERAFPFYNEALSLFERIGDPIGQTAALFGIAKSQQRQGDLLAAQDTSGRALRIAEDLRVKPLSESLRLSFFATVDQLFDLYIDVLMQLHRVDGAAGYAAEALHASERSRARSFLDLLNDSVADLRRDSPLVLLEREVNLQERLNRSVEVMEDETNSESIRDAASREVQRAIAEIDQVRGSIRQQSPRYAALTQPQPLHLGEMQSQMLDRDTVILQYRLGVHRSYLWLVTKDSLEAFGLPAGREIEDSARALHALLDQTPRRENEARTRRLLCDLSRDLLGPLAGKLGRKRLAIAADGALHYLPFAALPDPDTKNCLEAEPLVASHQIVHLPSVSTLATLRRDQEPVAETQGLVAVLADPVFSNDDPRLDTDSRMAFQANQSIEEMVVRSGGAGAFPRLARTRAEAEAILSMVPSERGYLALDFDASKETVLSGRLSKHRIVHFATHGVIDSQEPALSGIVLSQVDRGGLAIDGFLRTSEIFNLDLQAELVVLGACETALGKEVRGEGIIGLTRGFMYAGSPRVMVSLWRVGDRSTAILMNSFYRRLLADGLSPPEALQAAQIELRNRFPQPYYWAGFVLQGEWRPASFE